MGLSKNTVWRMNIDELKNVSVARVVIVEDDSDVENGSPARYEKIHRKAYQPGDDISELPAKVRQIIGVVWS